MAIIFGKLGLPLNSFSDARLGRIGNDMAPLQLLLIRVASVASPAASKLLCSAKVGSSSSVSNRSPSSSVTILRGLAYGFNMNWEETWDLRRSKRRRQAAEKGPGHEQLLAEVLSGTLYAGPAACLVTATLEPSAARRCRHAVTCRADRSPRIRCRAYLRAPDITWGVPSPLTEPETRAMRPFDETALNSCSQTWRLQPIGRTVKPRFGFANQEFEKHASPRANGRILRVRRGPRERSGWASPCRERTGWELDLKLCVLGYHPREIPPSPHVLQARSRDFPSAAPPRGAYSHVSYGGALPESRARRR